jgi:hypothetical protein
MHYLTNKNKKDKPQLNIIRNEDGSSRWALIEQVNNDILSPSIALLIRHNFGYEDMEDYKENAYNLELWMDGEKQRILSRKEFTETYQRIQEYEGDEAADKWDAGKHVFVCDRLHARGEEMKRYWEAITFELKIIDPAVTL